MMVKLRKYQLDAVKKAHNGCVLCGGTGSGKSITSLGYYYIQNGGPWSTLCGEGYEFLKEKPMDLYIITTARKRDTLEWEKDMAPFLFSTDPKVNTYKNKVVVDSWNNIHKYIDVKDAFFIFDEQRVVGRGVWVKSFLKIVKSNQWILLSATPGDSWGDYVPLFIANGFYKNRSQFSREHEVYAMYARYPKVERYVNVKKLEYLRSLILVDMDFKRPTVSHHKDVIVQYDGEAYRQLYRSRFDPWKEQPIENAAGLCYCLRKVVNSDESRQAAVLELCERHPKVIIFYNFTYERDILMNLGYLPGTAVAEWNGIKHELIPLDSDRWVYLVQYSAGAEGWNCIETDTIIFYSQNYSYKVMHQAEGRIDRMNTPYINLYYYHLKSSAPIDIAIGRALKAKKTFNEKRFTKWE